MSPRVLKICRFCEEENPSWATLCRGCGGSLEGAVLRPARRSLAVPKSMLIGLLLCVAAFYLFWSILQNMMPAVPGQKPLHVAWHKFYVLRAEETIVGEVVNRSDRPLTHLEVSGEFYNDEGREIEWRSAPLSPPDLNPGARARFEVRAPYLEDVSKSTFHFETTDGTKIPFTK